MQRVMRYFRHVPRRDADNMERLMVTGNYEQLKLPISTALHHTTKNVFTNSDRMKWSHDLQQLGNDCEEEESYNNFPLF